MKTGKIIIFILIVSAFLAGIYFKDDAIKFYSGLEKRVQDFKKTQVGQTIGKVGRQIFSPSPLNAGGSGGSAVLLQSKIISETNLQRQENGNLSTTLGTGLPVLTENSELDAAAGAKADDMFKNQYFEHVSLSGVDPGKLVQGFGYDYIVAGENLILGNFSSEKEVVQDWMNSPGHRANILNSRYTDIGVAIVRGMYKGHNAWIGVQEFGLPLSACTEPSIALKSQIDSENSRLDSMSLEIDGKKTEINNTGRNSAIYGQMVDDYNQLVSQYNLLASQTKADIAEYNNEVSDFNNCVAGK